MVQPTILLLHFLLSLYLIHKGGGGSEGWGEDGGLRSRSYTMRGRGGKGRGGGSEGEGGGRGRRCGRDGVTHAGHPLSCLSMWSWLGLLGGVGVALIGVCRVTLGGVVLHLCGVGHPIVSILHVGQYFSWAEYGVMQDSGKCEVLSSLRNIRFIMTA